jgi:predicted nucleic acid-binding protein
MGRPSCLLNPNAILIADASAVINLNATGCAEKILRALPQQVVVVDVVMGELEGGRDKARKDADLTRTMIESGLITRVELGPTGLTDFEELVIGSTVDTLDDGEAATLAYALEVGGTPIIDERKANRICAARFKELQTAASLDLFAHEAVEKALGRPALAEAVFLALRDARMRVFPAHIDWVVALIGKDRALQCPSLPRSLRTVWAVSSLWHRNDD